MQEDTIQPKVIETETVPLFIIYRKGRTLVYEVLDDCNNGFEIIGFLENFVVPRMKEDLM